MPSSLMCPLPNHSWKDADHMCSSIPWEIYSNETICSNLRLTPIKNGEKCLTLTKIAMLPEDPCNEDPVLLQLRSKAKILWNSLDVFRAIAGRLGASLMRKVDWCSLDLARNLEAFLFSENLKGNATVHAESNSGAHICWSLPMGCEMPEPLA